MNRRKVIKIGFVAGAMATILPGCVVNETAKSSESTTRIDGVRMRQYFADECPNIQPGDLVIDELNGKYYFDGVEFIPLTVETPKIPTGKLTAILRAKRRV